MCKSQEFHQNRSQGSEASVFQSQQSSLFSTQRLHLKMQCLPTEKFKLKWSRRIWRDQIPIFDSHEMNFSVGCVSRGGHKTYTSCRRCCLFYISTMNRDETSLRLGEFIWTFTYHTTMCVRVHNAAQNSKDSTHIQEKNEYWLLNTKTKKQKSTCEWVHKKVMVRREQCVWFLQSHNGG